MVDAGPETTSEEKREYPHQPSGNQSRSAVFFLSACVRRKSILQTI